MQYIMWKQSKKVDISSTASSLTVSWDSRFAQDNTKDKVNSFDIKFKESKTQMFTTIQASKDDTSIHIDDLKSSTVYVVNVYICYENGNIQLLFGTECTTHKSNASFLMKKALADRTQNPTFYHLQPVFTDIHPLQHINNEEDDASVIDQIRICDMIAKRKFGPRQNEEKTVLLLGATGSGKSTLIDALMNYIAGVSYNDDHRFFLINKTSEEEKRANKQFESQTSSVTVYRIPKMEGLRVTCGVNIIDTPGYNDTRANFDKRITDQIKELFDQKIDHLDAILIVVPLSTTRLTDAQQYVFSNILKMFGDDIKNNIFLATTWDDSGNLACVEVLDKAEVPYADIFRFNNANLYSAFSSDVNQESLNHKFWKSRTNSFSDLFKKLESTQKTTVKSSKEVMKARHNLEIQLIALEDTLSKEAQDIVNYKEDKMVLDAIEKASPENKKNSTYTRTVPVMKREIYGKSSIICPTCEKTCHKNCWAIFNMFKWTCDAMINNHCTVCDGRCDAANHEVSREEYKLYYVDKEFSGEDVVNRQKERQIAFGLLKSTLKLVSQLINEINTKALKKDAFTVEQYLDDLATKEEKEKKQDYEMRTQVQRKIQEHLEQNGSIIELTMDDLM